MSRLYWGVDALVEKDPVQKEWQYVHNLVDAESVEANARKILSASKLLATLTMLGARCLPGPQQPHVQRHAKHQ